MTLTEFLLARIDEDEVAALEKARWTWGRDDTSIRGVLFHAGGVRIEHAHIHDGQIVEEVEEVSFEDFQQRVRPLAALALADAEAKRRLVNEYAERDTDVDLMLGPDTRRQREWSGLHLAIKLLALPYADHPDYLEEWAVTP